MAADAGRQRHRAQPLHPAGGQVHDQGDVISVLFCLCKPKMSKFKLSS
jgi:hypothetical protein